LLDNSAYNFLHYNRPKQGIMVGLSKISQEKVSF
jgi:hypothetical protein